MEKGIFSIFDEYSIDDSQEDISSDSSHGEEKINTGTIEETYVCKECDYRWEYNDFSNENKENYCSMCGSTDILQIQ